jgi:hypothetical protein
MADGGLLMEHPTVETVNEWDDGSLFATLGYVSVMRSMHHGFDSLNGPERILCCLFLLENEVMNGGFGQWLANCHPQVIGYSVQACEDAGADLAARLVREVLEPLDNSLSFAGSEPWLDYLHGLPEGHHNRFETYIHPFVEIEPDLLKHAYQFGRSHWPEVRPF